MRSVLSFALLAALCSGQEVNRPRITGVAHFAIYAKDVEASRAFYHGLLGYDEAFWLTQPDGSLSLTFFKINERQYIELFPERAPNTDRLNHIALQVDNAEAMRVYLASKGVKVPDRTPKGRTGNSNFMIQDPDGHSVEIVQYESDSASSKAQGRSMPGNRVSDRAAHVGILVGSLDKAMDFYGRILGFEEIWRGSSNEKLLSWVNAKVPDGDDYVEFMLYNGPIPEPTKRGSAHHLCLFVPDMEKAKSALDLMPGRAAYSRPMEIRTGINRKRQLNLFDPDGTRVELMEPHTVDGKPAPSSKAPVPVGQP
ncbi:MAG: VOC family protein [Paludibaculum sp.]